MIYSPRYHFVTLMNPFLFPAVQLNTGWSSSLTHENGGASVRYILEVVGNH
jgi:hypothetical protein